MSTNSSLGFKTKGLANDIKITKKCKLQKYVTLSIVKLFNLQNYPSENLDQWKMHKSSTKKVMKLLFLFSFTLVSRECVKYRFRKFSLFIIQNKFLYYLRIIYVICFISCQVVFIVWMKFKTFQPKFMYLSNKLSNCFQAISTYFSSTNFFFNSGRPGPSWKKFRTRKE